MTAIKDPSAEALILYNDTLEFSARHYGGNNNKSPLVLCLHGYPDNWDSYRLQIDDLVAAGYRVVVPTMRGYEPSSIPEDNNFSIKAIAGDVIAWIDQLSISEVHLVGHDWGAAIAYAVAAYSPDKLISITTIAVPHPARFSREGIYKVPVQALKSWYMIFNLIPFLSEYIIRRSDWAFMRNMWKQWSPNLKIEDGQWLSLKATFEKPGVLTAILNYYRQNASILQLCGLKRADGREIKEIRVPNLAITGADDGCVDTRVFDHTILEVDHPAGYSIERIHGAGHFVHQEAPKEVNRLLIDWFRANETIKDHTS